MPWVVSSRLSDDKVFFGPKHNIYAFFMILFGLFDLILLFVCQICHVNCETEKLNIKEFFINLTYLLFLPFTLYFFSLSFLPSSPSLYFSLSLNISTSSWQMIVYSSSRRTFTKDFDTFDGRSQSWLIVGKSMMTTLKAYFSCVPLSAAHILTNAIILFKLFYLNWAIPGLFLFLFIIWIQLVESEADVINKVKSGIT